MRFALLFAAALAMATAARSATWQDQVDHQLGLLGHRNWILIVDSAYPLQVSPGVVTMDTNADHLTVLQDVLKRVGAARHVRPNLFEDKELAFVPEADAPGVERYRHDLAQVFGTMPVQKVLHDKILATIDEAGKTFRVLILKTTLTIPYTSVFIQLDCKYWSAEAEANLRQHMQ